nr:GTP-binding protein [Herpetosiphonaceae bacterium]
ALQQTFKDLPPTIFRAKGIVHLAEAPERRAIVQLSGKRASLLLAEAWGATPKRSQIVVIGAAAGFDPADLERRFTACVAESASAPLDPSVTSAEWLRAES